jgi:hypothetical protein
MSSRTSLLTLEMNAAKVSTTAETDVMAEVNTKAYGITKNLQDRLFFCDTCTPVRIPKRLRSIGDGL